MKDMKILHSMVYLDFWYSSLYLINKQFCISAISRKKSMKWHVCIYYTDIQNCLFDKYKDEYQKSKWTIECKIFISFIWSRSELWKPYNDNVFTKKLIFATYIGMSRFPQPYEVILFWVTTPTVINETFGRS